MCYIFPVGQNFFSHYLYYFLEYFLEYFSNLCKILKISNFAGLGGKEEEGLPAITKMISFSIKEDLGTQFFPGSTGCISHRPWNPPPTMGGPLHFISTWSQMCPELRIIYIRKLLMENKDSSSYHGNISDFVCV